MTEKKRNPFEKPAFVSAMQHIIKHETDKFVNFPKAGGKTKYGITQRQYPHLDIENLDQDTALKIYKEDYWNKIRGDELPKSVAKTVMDSAVLEGQPTAIRLLQTTVGEKPTGILGPRTLQATFDYVAEHGEKTLAQRINAKRKERVSRLKHRAKFGKGWINRISDLERGE